MIELHVFDDPRAQTDALARAVGDALKASLAAQVSTGLAAPAAAGAGTGTRRATLAVSGGTSPRPFLAALSTQRFDWAHIDVTLVDDRWVPDTDTASNARLVHETLLQNEAAHARFLPLVDPAYITSRTLDEQIAALNADPRRLLPDVAVLGMGEDGHTASIFADAPEWHEATTTARPFVAVHPASAPHARVSWSLAALRQVGRLFLLIAGERKLEVLQQAAAAPQKNAISKLANDNGVKLDVYWCAN